MTAAPEDDRVVPPRLADLIGLPDPVLVARLGEPEAARTVAGAVWRTWSGPGWELRVRSAPPAARAGAPTEARGSPDVAERRVVSWSLLWSRGRETLRAAVEPLGLWPAAGPDTRPEELDLPLARRGIRRREGGPEISLTVGVSEGAFVRVACFDEAPDWR